MKKVKNLLLVMIAAFAFIMPLSMSTVSAKEKDKVKVYIFEAGGCPYCEMQLEDLKSLDSYGKKFEVIVKELYVDHIDWEIGKDYGLGEKVANAFTDAGYENASIYGTPFVVVSDIYAETGYNPNMESIINKAYEEGDNDAVSCIEKGKSNCVTPLPVVEPNSAAVNSSNSSNDLLLYILLGAVAVLVVLNIFELSFIITLKKSLLEKTNNNIFNITSVKNVENETEELKKAPTRKPRTTKKSNKEV